MIFKSKKPKSSSLFSAFLQRKVEIEIFRTRSKNRTVPYGLLLLNDGQLFEALEIEKTVNDLYRKGLILPLQVVAIHAGDRTAEYGVSGMRDYLGRGEKAIQYENFIVHELLPVIRAGGTVHFNASRTAFAGCSLGGLSAIDIVTSNPTCFTTAGVFSGSLWWRTKSYEEGYTDHDRIIFNKINHTGLASNFRCYLMAGTNDEKNDRNGNGVIDAVDDTLDLYDLLAMKINKPDQNLFLTIVNGGSHDTNTWSKQFPEFLLHAFGKG